MWITQIKGLSTGTPVLPVCLGMINLHPSRISHSKQKEISLSWSLWTPTPAEIPDWLQVYARAPVKHNHILKRELFQLADLDTYQGMLKLLLMKELEQIVKLYEAYRQALVTELENLKQRQQWFAQHHGKKFLS